MSSLGEKLDKDKGAESASLMLPWKPGVEAKRKGSVYTAKLILGNNEPVSHGWKGSGGSALHVLLGQSICIFIKVRTRAEDAQRQIAAVFPSSPASAEWICINEEFDRCCLNCHNVLVQWSCRWAASTIKPADNGHDRSTDAITASTVNVNISALYRLF